MQAWYNVGGLLRKKVANRVVVTQWKLPVCPYVGTRMSLLGPQPGTSCTKLWQKGLPVWTIWELCIADIMRQRRFLHYRNIAFRSYKTSGTCAIEDHVQTSCAYIYLFRRLFICQSLVFSQNCLLLSTGFWLFHWFEIKFLTSTYWRGWVFWS